MRIDKKQRLNEIRQFLAPYEGIFTREILDAYPETLNSYPKAWIEALQQLSPTDLFHFDSRKSEPHRLPNDLQNWWQKLSQLTSFPEIKRPEFTYDDWTWSKVTAKKKHELTKMISVVQTLTQSPIQIIDLCAGMGHMSRLLSGHHQHQCTVVDFDEQLLQKGNDRLKKHPMSFEPNVQFIKKDVLKDDLNDLFRPHQFSLALHNCGALSIKHLELIKKNPQHHFINVGCCYYKMPVHGHTNLSSYAQELNLPWTSIALYLSTRAHYQQDINDFETKIQVKKFRYTFHLLLLSMGIEIKAVGEVPVRLYRGFFSDYAMLKLTEHKIEHHFTVTELEGFFNHIENQKMVWEMILANLIRWQLGRILETYLILDRALWLEESGVECEVARIFDEQISPRNLAIIG
ncbi:MAG: hypothetical protein COW00_16900 [Bdellovibrio sp. CG12_big_fil_rev_8_21_14_0_65_39_13]|nr:MAG: hypothetical protein COW78_11625 [Bdellovibrio sp. CG22_combo_CG10-13_8_21_14_all_39_27]PIQ58200.1 MAG: hypothetical protein COW00_16900 [Bdellovibrio sp. CG12_big_fil_rev_8_21_14_0_65_39_13]PIR35288.1 MAG: hypothetical protein COV37_09330 [Bdellovibrio sp. CG11_big_fil_rev_8_21_14_0_20_39_38]